jgi:hypothetical protein
MEPILRWSIIAYTSTLVFEGPLRWALGNVGLEKAIYLRDLLLVSLIGLIAAQGLSRQRPINAPFALLAGLMVFHALIALIYLPNIPQILFGLKILLPLFFGILAYPQLEKTLHRLALPLGILLLAAIAGVVVDKYVDYPWRGVTFEIANVVVIGNRVWTSMGAERIAGLSRASYEAATQIALLSCFVLAFSRRPLLNIALVCAAMAAIYLTTTKGALLAFMVIVMFVFTRFLGAEAVAAWRAVPAAVALIVMLVPTIFLTFGSGVDWYRASRAEFLQSFFDRVEDVWPAGIELIKHSGSYILGRGVGGIGVAQRYFEGRWGNPADSLFMYCYVSFGVLGCLYLLWLGLAAIRLRIRAPGTDQLLFMVVVVFFVYGITTSSLENAVQSLLLGFAVSGLARASASGEAARRGSAAVARPAAAWRRPQPTAG